MELLLPGGELPLQGGLLLGQGGEALLPAGTLGLQRLLVPAQLLHLPLELGKLLSVLPGGGLDIVEHILLLEAAKGGRAELGFSGAHNNTSSVESSLLTVILPYPRK